MSLPVLLVHVAGGVQLVVASANIFAFGKFHYREHLRPLPTVIQQVFMVQNGYIMLTQTGFALLCFNFAPELVGGARMGQAISAFLAFFWASRVWLQLYYYDGELRRQNKLFDWMFLAGDGYLALTFALAAWL